MNTVIVTETFFWSVRCLWQTEQWLPRWQHISDGERLGLHGYQRGEASIKKPECNSAISRVSAKLNSVVIIHTNISNFPEVDTSNSMSRMQKKEHSLQSLLQPHLLQSPQLVFPTPAVKKNLILFSVSIWLMKAKGSRSTRQKQRMSCLRLTQLTSFSCKDFAFLFPNHWKIFLHLM